MIWQLAVGSFDSSHSPKAKSQVSGKKDNINMKKKKKGENSTAKQAWLIWVDNLGTFYNERLFVLLINFAVTYQCQSF